MNRRSSPARARLLERLSQDLRALYEYDLGADAAAGSPDPGVTAMGQLLCYALTFARVGLAHRQAGQSFEQVVTTAHEMEAEGWAAHRSSCTKCGGH